MKIDLHCHTKKTKNGDAETRNVTPELFAQKVADAGVSVVAITNHNCFDYEQFKVLSSKVKDYCDVWPGIELDIEDISKKRWHLIVVVNPEHVDEFDFAMQSLFSGKDINEISFTLHDIINTVTAFDALYIPHYHKANSISEDDWAVLQKLVPDSFRIFRETSNNRSLGVFSNYQYRVIVGSDVEDWSVYEDSTFAELRLPVKSYSQFMLLAQRDNVIVETLLNSKRKYQVIASPHSSVKFSLTIYQEMNVIFGQKGTGKSEILKSIRDALVMQGLSCVYYEGTNRVSDFDKFLSTSDMTRDLSIVNLETSVEELKTILEWSDSLPTLFSNYVKWYETLEINKNKSRMKITNATSLAMYPAEKLRLAKDDWEAAKAALEKSNDVRLNLYLNSEEIKELIALLTKLLKGTQQAIEREYISAKAVELTNFSIEKIKQFADKNTDTKSFPSTTGFSDYAIQRVKLKESMDTIQESFEAKEIRESRLLGTLEDKGDVYITSIYRMLGKGSTTAEFAKGIRELKAIKRKLDVLAQNTFSPDIPTHIEELSSLCKESNVNDLSPFIGLSRITTSEDGEIYNPSDGEKGILLLQQNLETEGDAYLIDEPELGMGNSYIDQCIRPRLRDLARQQKTVVVVTHNANIAVRTLPYQTVFRRHRDNEYNTYTGNPFVNELININEPTDILIWKDESMHTLEGGREAFYEREHIYESGSHQC